MRIVFLESFYGGSHKNFLDGLVKYSRHQIEPITLPARFWKWRLRASALYFAEQYAKSVKKYDLLIATDMLNLAEFKALSNYDRPMVMFFHENQLTYPLPERESFDPHFGLINIVSALAADLNLFNSIFQLERFNEELPEFVNRIPEFVPLEAPATIRRKSRVIYMGCDFSAFKNVRPVKNDVPVILWNHRWEFDKQPQVFFRVLYRLAEEGVPFKLVILGENYQVHPKEFLQAREQLKDRILQFGFVESKEDYAHFLEMSDIVVSTAIQENFGFSVTEAIYCYTLPLLPRRLSYPEILDKRFHKAFLYKNEEDLLNKLRHLLLNYRQYDQTRIELSESMRKFDWQNRIEEFDQLFEDVVAQADVSA
ncbi:MAG: DUF3524 domain-containing protein [candidate division KSB1 bacterium]|nr:DUF3524 domain-containing protein [candidate division KSB1 bacterium]